MELELFVTRGLGDATYLVGSGDEAVIVDPQRDVGRFLDRAERRGLAIRAVLETHVHNDYVSGALAIAAATGAAILAPADGGYAFPHRAVADADELTVGDLRLVARATPGHTPEHLAWEIVPVGAAGPVAVLTGGSLLVGSAGRTDLLGPDRTAELTAAQFRSLRRLAELPDAVRVLPTHGAGSLCVAGSAEGARTSTIGEERSGNPLLRSDDEDAFAAALRAGLGPYPTYYGAIAPLNRAGMRGGRPERPPFLGAEEVARAMSNGAWVIDARDRTAFARGHLPGSINVELGASFAGYVGWLVPHGVPLVLLLPAPVEAAALEAATQLFRIGWDRILGVLEGGAEGWLVSGRTLEAYGVTDVDDVAATVARGGAGRLVDVRGETEWRDGVVPGSILASFSDLAHGAVALPREEVLTVACRAGTRAAVAASRLARDGYRVRVLVDGGIPDLRAALGAAEAGAAGPDRPGPTMGRGEEDGCASR